MSHFILFHFNCLSSLLHWNWKITSIKFTQIFKYFATNEKWCQIWICLMESVGYYFISIVWVHFSHKTDKFWFWKSLKDLFFEKIIYDVRFEYVPWRNVWFCFNSILWIQISHNTEKCWFWKPLKYFITFFYQRKKNTAPDLV